MFGLGCVVVYSLERTLKRRAEYFSISFSVNRFCRLKMGECEQEKEHIVSVITGLWAITRGCGEVTWPPPQMARLCMTGVATPASRT